MRCDEVKREMARKSYGCTVPSSCYTLDKEIRHVIYGYDENNNDDNNNNNFKKLESVCAFLCTIVTAQQVQNGRTQNFCRSMCVVRQSLIVLASKREHLCLIAGNNSGKKTQNKNRLNPKLKFWPQNQNQPLCVSDFHHCGNHCLFVFMFDNYKVE